MRLALVTAVPAMALDEDLPPLIDACRAAGIEATIAAWDDPTISWQRFDAALLRSTWDYVERLPEFLHWCDHVEAHTRLLNPAHVVRTNTDKHYLAALSGLGIATVPSQFIEPGEAASPAVTALLASHPASKEFVVKPAVGAGSRDAQRYGREHVEAASAHCERLLAAGRSVLLQPYLASVDEAGETALLYFGGVYSHAIRKGPLLRRGEGPTSHLFAPEAITAREPGADERALAERILHVLPGLFGLERPLVYARIDLIRGDDGAPRLLELELTEPSLFFAHAADSAKRLVAALARQLSD